jgi:ethanolamine utilization protein EutN
MHVGRVIGTLVATRKVAPLRGCKLLIVQPLTPEGEERGRALVAVDTVRAGPGDVIYYVRGREAAHTQEDKFNPADTAIVGIVDRIDL